MACTAFAGNGQVKLTDPRKKLVERVIRFGDSCQVSDISFCIAELGTTCYRKGRQIAKHGVMFWDSARAGLVMHDVVRCLLWLGAALLGNSGQKPKEQHSRTCNNFDVWTDYLFKRKLWYFCVRCRHWTPSSVNKMAPHPGCANRMKAQIMCRDLVGYSYNVVVCVVVCVCVF